MKLMPYIMKLMSEWIYVQSNDSHESDGFRRVPDLDMNFDTFFVDLVVLFGIGIDI